MEYVLTAVALIGFALLIRHLIRSKTPDVSGNGRYEPKPDDLPRP